MAKAQAIQVQPGLHALPWLALAMQQHGTLPAACTALAAAALTLTCQQRLGLNGRGNGCVHVALNGQPGQAQPGALSSLGLRGGSKQRQVRERSGEAAHQRDLQSTHPAILIQTMVPEGLSVAHERA